MHKKPYVFMFHGLMTSSEAKTIRELAAPMVSVLRETKSMPIVAQHCYGETHDSSCELRSLLSCRDAPDTNLPCRGIMFASPLHNTFTVYLRISAENLFEERSSLSRSSQLTKRQARPDFGFNSLGPTAAPARVTRFSLFLRETFAATSFSQRKTRKLFWIYVM